MPDQRTDHPLPPSHSQDCGASLVNKQSQPRSVPLAERTADPVSQSERSHNAHPAVHSSLATQQSAPLQAVMGSGHVDSSVSSPHPENSEGRPAEDSSTHPALLTEHPAPPALPPAHSGPQRFPAVADPRQPYNAEQMAAVLPLMDTFNAMHNIGGNFYY